MERTIGIICNSLRALLRHFIQHLVKGDLFCFASVVWNTRRSQFVGSFVKRWTASVASQRCHGAEKSSLSLSWSVDGDRAGGDWLCSVLNVDWRTMKAKGSGRSPLPKIDS